MRRRGGGNIVVIASEWGVTGWPNATAYSASKAGLIALTKSLGRELAPEHIIVNAIAPGVIDTPQLQVDADDAGIILERDARASTRREIPLGRIGTPTTIAAAVVIAGARRIWAPSSARRFRSTEGQRGAGHDRHRVQPVDGTVVPRYAGFSTFARLPRIDDVPTYDVAVVGIPVRHRGQLPAGRPLRARATCGSALGCCGHTIHRWKCRPFANQQVVDAGDIPCTPYDIATAVRQIEEHATALTANGARLITIGGDHTIAYPLLRVHRERYGPVALVHFDAHLDTWDTYFDAP